MHKFTTALALITFANLAHANNEAIAKCRQVGDPAQRFACYEKIDISVAPPAPVAAAPAKSDMWGFLKRTPSNEPKFIESEIEGEVTGWRPGQVIALKNGQKWRIADGSDGMLYKGRRKVIIENGLMGGHFMKFEGLNTQPAVIRVQ
ncbi:MAG: hypothetical protein V4723_07120 [Pseudomonadota bacterium]